MTLQQILAHVVGDEIILNDSNSVKFEENGDKVRKHLFGPSEATYSGYTCYSGIADFVPVDIETVGDVPGSPESNRNESKILGNLPGCSTQGFSTTDDLHKEGLTKNYVIII
ncbi:zeaxanthin epoxidase, chloroplastic-like [Mangifera indica]|uniref:zeaxanthin epoxidase, chloroplastic-like n=1 Tax=Mangifera indica TaxID=29780 RepID=UPI001CF9C14E|nr:zeaxanthin epoxidase, chloroplastic-like [Mangifera indica]